MYNELVSIIVPVYNTEMFLNKCIDSILNQTYTYFELILVDDGSTDGSFAICKEYEKKDSRIKHIYKDNEGAGYARNYGIDNCHGRYITFVDSDDWVDTDWLESMVNSIGDCDILQIGTHVYSPDGLILREDQNNEEIKGIRNGYEVNKALLEGRYTCGGVPWGKLYKNELWEDIRFPKLKRFEDVAVLYKIYWKADKVKVVPISKYCYRSQRQGSIMHSVYSLEWLSVLDIEKEKINFYRDNNSLELCNLTKFEYCNAIIINIKKIKKYLPDEKNEVKKLVCLLKTNIKDALRINGYVVKKIKLVIKAIMTTMGA